MSADPLQDRLRVIAPVGDGVPGGRQARKQLRHGSLVGCLARAQHEALWQPTFVDHDVDFGAQSASRSSDGVIRAPFFPPAACWWARTIEESIR